ncbi:unnamed protein product [Coregonus sp. 'balchen']|nr:unnamed protein product [Coregonus sp. 'balchen']
MPVKDHPILNNPDATKETNFKSLLEQLVSLRVKDDSSPGNVGQLTKGYSSKNVKDPPDFVESLPLNYVTEHKPLMPVKDLSVQNNPDDTEETNYTSLLEELESLWVKDEYSPSNVGQLTKGYSSKNVKDPPDFVESLPLNYVTEHKPLMPVKDLSVQNNPDDTEETNYTSLLEELESLWVEDEYSPGNLGQLTKEYSSKNDNPDATKETNFKSLLKSTLKIKPRVNILTDPSYSEPLVKVNLILGPVFYSFILIVVLYEAVRISKEARRRSNAIATARLKKREPATAEASNYEATEKPCYTQSWLTEVCVN